MPQPDADLAEQRQIVAAFLAASRAGDFDALMAILDPDVVLRASGTPALQQERKGAAEVAGTVTTIGPRFALLCHPATVNGQAGLILNTPVGPLGAVGFTVSNGLITTIDFTLDPDKLEGLDRTDDAGRRESPHGREAANEPSLLSYLRGRQGSVAERIIAEALSWPGVYRETGQLGAVALRIGRHELGHLHGDAVADVPLAPTLQDQLREDGVVQDHELRRDSGWVTVPLGSEEDVRRALALLRVNYQRATDSRSTYA
jgi:hypothetical protein